jgi:phage-related protein
MALTIKSPHIIIGKLPKKMNGLIFAFAANQITIDKLITFKYNVINIRFRGMIQMHEVYFYEDKDGNSPVYDYLKSLSQRNDKNSRINHNKIQDYIEVLSRYGKAAGEPYIKHIDGEIWELRPIKNRIFFAGWLDGSFILLHHFVKKTQKTPKHEIDKAKRNLKERSNRE